VPLLAGQTALWLALGLAAAFLFVLAALALLAVTLAVFDGDADDVADIQRFIALTEEGRSLVPAGLRFQAKKDEARRALWTSRNGAPRNREHKTPTTQRRPSRIWPWPTEQSGGGRGLVEARIRVPHPKSASQGVDDHP
jgi:hypothetical protein